MRRVALAVGVVGALIAAAPASLGAVAPTPAAAVQDVLWYQQCANSGASMMGSWGDGNYSAGTACPTTTANAPYRGLWLYSNGYTGGGTVAHWEADAPGNIGIVMAHAPEMTTNFPSYFYGGFFYWAGGNSGWLASSGGNAISWPSASGWQSLGPSPYFGFELACNAATQCATGGAYFDVYNLQLEAYEYQTPSIYAGPASGSAHLWYQGGKWIRGVFPVDLRGSDPSGVCRMLVSWDGQVVQDSGERSPNGAYWDQCDPNHLPNSPQDFFVGATIDTRTAVPTSRAGVQLALAAHNASYNPATGAPDWTSAVEDLNVDNEPVGLSLNGPTQASIGDGTQHVTATASAGASGVGSIVCSVDGSPWSRQQLRSGAGTQTAEVPVSGLGQHQVSCYATNQSVDSSGHPAASAVQTWSLKIAKPVGAGITFAKVIRHCRRELRRVHTQAGTRRKWVKVCSTQTIPRHVAHVAYGRGVTVYGWLTSFDGIPIGNAPVRILAAPDNGSGAWHTVAVLTTSADGSWQATLHPGPSRLIQATYAGGPDTEAASSAVVKVIVPAKVVLTHVTRRVPWGGVLVIQGRLLGGDLPHEQILQLRSGVGRHLQVIGNPYIGPDGRFVIRLAATGSGGSLRTQIAVTTLKETNYPYARGASPRVWVTIG